MSTEPKSTSNPIIYCGIGIDSIKIGMTYHQATTILGEGIRKTHDEEAEGFGGYEKFLQFVIGFDFREEYTGEDNVPYPIFKVWYKNDVIESFMISSYGNGIFDLDYCKRYKTESHLHIGESIERMLELYGEPHYIHDYSPHANYIYPELGVGFVCNTESNTIRSLYIFDKTDAEVKQKIKDFYDKCKIDDQNAPPYKDEVDDIEDDEEEEDWE